MSSKMSSCYQSLPPIEVSVFKCSNIIIQPVWIIFLSCITILAYATVIPVLFYTIWITYITSLAHFFKSSGKDGKAFCHNFEKWFKHMLFVMTSNFDFIFHIFWSKNMTLLCSCFLTFLVRPCLSSIRGPDDTR